MLITNIFFPKIKPVARMIADSLAQDPDSWSADNYNLVRGNGDQHIKLWVANRDYGLKVEHPPGYPLNWRERRLVWKAFVKWRETPRNVEDFRRKLALKAVS